jgi:hypothetical protein
MVPIEEQLGDVVEPLVFNTKAYWSLDYLEWFSNQLEPQVPLPHTPFVPQSKALGCLQILGFLLLLCSPSTCVPSFVDQNNS